MRFVPQINSKILSNCALTSVGAILLLNQVGCAGRGGTLKPQGVQIKWTCSAPATPSSVTITSSQDVTATVGQAFVFTSVPWDGIFVEENLNVSNAFVLLATAPEVQNNDVCTVNALYQTSPSAANPAAQGELQIPCPASITSSGFTDPMSIQDSSQTITIPATSVCYFYDIDQATLAATQSSLPCTMTYENCS